MLASGNTAIKVRANAESRGFDSQQSPRSSSFPSPSSFFLFSFSLFSFFSSPFPPSTPPSPFLLSFLFPPLYFSSSSLLLFPHLFFVLFSLCPSMLAPPFKCCNIILVNLEGGYLLTMALYGTSDVDSSS